MENDGRITILPSLQACCVIKNNTRIATASILYAVLSSQRLGDVVLGHRENKFGFIPGQ
jgi:hypothetical protein